MEQTAPLRPMEDGRGGLERLRKAPFELNPPLVFEVTNWHPQNVPGKIEMSSPCQHNWETDMLERLGQIEHQRDRSLVQLSPSMVKPFHFEQRFPRRTLLTSIAPASRIPPNTCLSCHLFTSGARNDTHQRIKVVSECNGGFDHDVLRNQEKHCRASLFWPYPDFPEELHHFLTRFLREVRWDPWLKPSAALSSRGFVAPRRPLPIVLLQVWQIWVSSKACPP